MGGTHNPEIAAIECDHCGDVQALGQRDHHIRVYSAERTVADLMRLHHRLGEPLALGALRRYLRRRDARPGQLLSFARALDILGPLRTALDIASAE